VQQLDLLVAQPMPRHENHHALVRVLLHEAHGGLAHQRRLARSSGRDQQLDRRCSCLLVRQLCQRIYLSEAGPLDRTIDPLIDRVGRREGGDIVTILDQLDGFAPERGRMI
jgi:hypothetical protein